MLFAGTGQTICMAVLAATVAYPESKPAGYCATAFLFLFNTFFAVGFVGIPFCKHSAPPHLRLVL